MGQEKGLVLVQAVRERILVPWLADGGSRMCHPGEFGSAAGLAVAAGLGGDVVGLRSADCSWAVS